MMITLFLVLLPAIQAKEEWETYQPVARDWDRVDQFLGPQIRIQASEVQHMTDLGGIPNQSLENDNVRRAFFQGVYLMWGALRTDTVFYFEDGGAMSFREWVKAKGFAPSTSGERQPPAEDPNLPCRLMLARLLWRLDRKLNAAVTIEHARSGPVDQSTRNAVHPETQSDEEKVAYAQMKHKMTAETLEKRGFSVTDANEMHSLAMGCHRYLKDHEKRLDHMSFLYAFIKKWNMRLFVKDNEGFVEVSEYFQKRLPVPHVDREWPAGYEPDREGSIYGTWITELDTIDIAVLSQQFEEGLEQVIRVDQKDTAGKDAL